MTISFDLETDPSLDTLALHAGAYPDPATGALLTPIYQSTTYVLEAVGSDKGFTYSRTANPTVSALERRLAALEGAEHASCFGTGLGATTALALALLQAGDRAVLSDVVYGGTVRLFQKILAKFGVESEFVDAADPAAWEAALRRPARLVFVETPANPTLKLTDLEVVARLAHGAGAVVVVDNTLLTPVLQRPLDLGADIVLHSTTKFIEGHNATLGGALITRDAELHEKLDLPAQRHRGHPVAVQRLADLAGGEDAAAAHGAPLGQRPARGPLSRKPSAGDAGCSIPVSSPSRSTQLARRQQGSGGALMAFEVEGGTEAGVRVMNGVRLCALAENLGAAETLVTHPASMTHAAVPLEQRLATGITDGLIRLSVGLENPDDIIADLRRALEA